MSTSIKTPDENPSNVESILSDMNGLPGYTIEPPGSRIETLLIMMDGAFASSIVASIDENFVMSITLKNNKGETIGTTQTIDLPLESVIVNGSYDSTNKKLVFVLENGNTIDVPIGDLISGLQEEITSTNKLDADLVDDSTSTNKFNAQGNWNESNSSSPSFIQNKPTLGTASALDVAASGDASNTEVVKGNDSRLTNARNAADVYSWAKEANKPSYTGSEITLTGYTEAQSKASVAATDTTNAAIGKLEYRVETNETNILNIQQEQTTQNQQIATNTNEIATLREITNCKLYGFKIDKQDVNPDTRVTYLYDAVGMTPAYMDFTNGSFNYGSWADIWFVKNNRPVALNFDGTVDYELSHTDFTKKIDGITASDVEDVNYDGNFMSEIPLVYAKRWEDERYNYIVFSETKPNDDYLAQAHTNVNGTINPFIYLPMFKGSIDANNKLRSLMGTIPNGNTTAANEVSYVENCGTGWQLWDKAKIDLIMDLIVLITKSTNCRGKIGNGDCQTYNASDTRKDSKNNAANGKMMSGYEIGDSTRSANAQFYGSEGTDVTNYGKHHMIAFYIEDLWANRWDRCLGFNLVDNVYKVKMTPPYALDSDSTYQTLSITPPSATEGWLKNVSSGIYGDVPTEVGASNTSGFANYFYKNASGARLSLFGGAASYGLAVGRSWHLANGATVSGWHIGGSPCYNAL